MIAVKKVINKTIRSVFKYNLKWNDVSFFSDTTLGNIAIVNGWEIKNIILASTAAYAKSPALYGKRCFTKIMSADKMIEYPNKIKNVIKT